MAIDPNGKLNVAGMHNDLATFRRENLTQGDADVEDVVDDSFRTAALRDIGP
jgi:hypothetical protein